MTRPWTPDELAELRILTVWGVTHGDIQAFAAKHGRPYGTINTALVGMRGLCPSLTYAERMGILKGQLAGRFAEPKLPGCPAYDGPDWIGKPIDPPKDTA